MTKHSVLRTCLIAGALGLVAQPVAAATYRWVDSSGKVHYSDTMPPQQAGMGHQELDKQGRVVRDVERTRRTAEEQRRAEEARQAAETARQQKLEQERRDRALLTSYTSVEEIDLVRDRALELEKLQIDSLQAQMTNASEKLTYANGEIRKYSGQGLTTPKSFLQMRDEAQNDLARIGGMLQQRQNNLDEIRAKYEADKQRFRELKGLR
jgi:hypothetical protein